MIFAQRGFASLGLILATLVGGAFAAAIAILRFGANPLSAWLGLGAIAGDAGAWSFPSHTS